MTSRVRLGKSGGCLNMVGMIRNRNITLRLWSEISMRILKSRWFLVDVVEGFVVVVVGFVLLLGEFLHSSVPLLFYVVEGSIDFSFDLSLFVGVMVLFLPFSFVFVDLSVGR